MAEGRVEIVVVDEDRLGSELMAWAGVTRAWDRCISYWSKREHLWDHEFGEEVAEECRHLFIDYEEWDADLPGRSGSICTVETSDPAAARRELRGKLAASIRTWRKELEPIGTASAQVPNAPPLSTKAECYSVRGTPVAVELVRGWGGYGGNRVTAYDIPGGRPFPMEEVTRDGTAISRPSFDALTIGSSEGQRPKSEG